jgi:cation:H+ antiporter
MSLIMALGLFVLGLAIVIFCAEQLVKGVIGTSLHFGISPFLLSVLFIGFDPDNLSVGAVAAYEGVAGIAWGAILGATMVAIALAFGVSALFAPMRFAQVSRQLLVVPVLAVLVLGGLSLDGQLSRSDGVVLLLAFVGSLLWMVQLSKSGLDLKPTGEVAESLEKAQRLSRGKALGFLVVSLAGVVLGSELLVTSSQTIIGAVGLSETVFGMTILAFVVSIEELERELPAALKGRPDISFGNVVGSILAMCLFNGGIMALVKPVVVPAQVWRFSLPYVLGTVLIIALLMLTHAVPRWAGGMLIVLYLGFIAGNYVVQ